MKYRQRSLAVCRSCALWRWIYLLRLQLLRCTKYGLLTAVRICGKIVPSRTLSERENNMIIRRFQKDDAEKVSEMIIRTIKTSNSKDYSEAAVAELEKQMQPEMLMDRAGWTHFYVAEENDSIIGCGAIGPYWGSETESSLFTIFVLPACQGKGIGRQIIETLEQDEYFLRAKRVEVPASITAVDFYRRLGYDYKNGVDHPDEERVFRLEKFR